ncbi:hypothetical protein VTN77DRAFT_1515 [Rasamsonia byssochlamydoides]|uniref:uncharacterized protein n=1 Tax=Rasamsonia byssochlamydoides TaxID=89139 RepID=UPI00374274C5
MVNWKASDATDRLFGALIAAHPELRLDYSAMATMYGRGATYDAIKDRFRKFCEIAGELRTEATGSGVNIRAVPRGRKINPMIVPPTGTPRTPRTRGPGNGVTKSGGGGSSSGRAASGKFDAKMLNTPTKTGRGTLGQSIIDAITVETDSESDTGSGSGSISIVKAERNVDVNVKVKDEPAGAEKDDVHEGCQILDSIEKFKEEPAGNDDKKKDTKHCASAKNFVFLANQPRPYVDSRTNGYVDVPATAVAVQDIGLGSIIGPSRSANGFNMHLNRTGGLYFGSGHGHAHGHRQYDDDVDPYADTA